MHEFFPQCSPQRTSRIRAKSASNVPCLKPNTYDPYKPDPRPRWVHVTTEPLFSSQSRVPHAVSFPRAPSYQTNPQPRVEFAIKPESREYIDAKEVGRLAHVEEQKNMAYRENPNVFQKEEMLYINAIVNGVAMPLFVDTGAQASVMSLETCRNLGLSHEIDESEAGIASGVGVARIYGKLWRVPVQIGKKKFFVQFNILDMGVRLILGLDQMKRLEMSVDLGRGGCVVGNSFVPFVKPPDRGQSIAVVPCAIM